MGGSQAAQEGPLVPSSQHHRCGREFGGRNSVPHNLHPHGTQNADPIWKEGPLDVIKGEDPVLDLEGP